MSQNDPSLPGDLQIETRPLTLEFVLGEVKRILDEERKHEGIPEKRAA